MIDDTDKIRQPNQIEEIFASNLSALLAPRVPVVMTVPSSVSFGGPTTQLGASVTHLRPVQVLRKDTGKNPMLAKDEAEISYLCDVLRRRVSLSLFEDGVVEQAAVYSGGVLREFFRLLRLAAIRAADLYGLSMVDALTFEDTRIEARNDLFRGLLDEDKKVLSTVHLTHELAERKDLNYMNTSLVLEYNHDGIWWEATPLLWEMPK